MKVILENYPLSPMQQGLLFDSVYAGRPGVGIEQVLVTLPEAVDRRALARAWTRVVERHPVLRTGFRWERLPVPRQEVHRSAALEWTEEDWWSPQPAAIHQQLEARLDQERMRGFDLAAPPLMRLVLARTGPAEFQLVWTFHHLLLDGRALVVLLGEVFAYYEAFRQGGDLALSPPVPYGRYIRWIERQDWGRSEPYWRDRLRGFSSPTPLPAAAAGAKRSDDLPGEQSLTVSTELTEACALLARRNDSTLNTLVQGAWALVLGRYCGADDVVFGAVRACRHLPVGGVEGMVGLLINTVPFRAALPADRPVGQWLGDLRRAWVDLRPHEATPLVAVQGWSDVPRGMPLFNTIFNYQEPGWDAALRAQGGPWARRQFGIRSQPGYPLSVDAYGGPQLRIKLLYDRHSYNTDAIAQMLVHLHNLLEGMAADPGRPLGKLEMFNSSERRNFLGGWHGPKSDFISCPVNCLVEARAGESPDAPAVVDSTMSLTYAQLEGRAASIASRLQDLKAGSGCRVAVCMERGVDMVAALLAVWKAGGVQVPLDPEYPAARLGRLLGDAAVSAVLTQRRFADRLGEQGAAIVCVDEIDTSATPALPRAATGPDDAAYIIYTSGSTGDPKGVVVTHRSLCNLVGWHQQAYWVTPADRATQLASPAFDAAVWELWPYLAAGASVHVPDAETRLSPAKLRRWLADRGITLCFIPTPLLESMSDGPWPAETRLRAILTGGDRLHRAAGPDFPCAVVNHYGPTECTVVATAGVVERGGATGAAPPIGRPISNLEAYVLDERLQPLPIGSPGGLYLGGVGLARGYFNRPAETADRFLPHPFDPEPGARLYRTGDLVQWRPDGQLDFLGRLDDQVKIRGYRIEPGEIETLLLAHPEIEECAVVARQSGGATRLAAFCVAGAGGPPSVFALRQFLAERLPEAVIPGEFGFLPSLPLTPNGKVDRRTLAARAPESETAVAEEPPRTGAETTLARIWNEVLGRKSIGRAENFFAIGGHSLLAAQLAARVQESLGVELPVRAVFDHPTIAALADAVAASPRRKDGGDSPIKPRGHARPAWQTVAS